MNIMLLTSEGFDTPNSINHLLISLCEDIMLSKHNLYLVSSHKTGIYSDIPSSLRKYDNLSYDIIRRKSIDRNKFVKRYLDEVWFCIRAMKKWYKKRKEMDVVVLQSNPTSVLNALFLHFLMRKPIILNLYDVFPGHADKIGVINNRFVYKVLQGIQNLLYSTCKKIVVMSDDMKDIMMKKEKVKEEKLVVVNNWFDDKMFSVVKREDNLFFIKYNLDINKFYVQFAGLLGYVFDAEMYLNVAERLKNDSRICFLLIGDGNLKTSILNEIKARELMNVYYFPWQPLDMINHVYNACDIGFIPLKPGVIGNGIPSKACQLMAAERVVLNSVEESNYVNLFNKYEMGESVTNNDPDSVASKIIYLLEHPELRKKIGVNASDYAWQHYSRSVNTHKFISLIESVAFNRGMV